MLLSERNAMTWIKTLNKRVRAEDSLSSARRKAALMISFIIIATALFFYLLHPYRSHTQLLNIAYDAPRIYFQQVDTSCAMDVKTSHAGSILQTESLTKGLVADTVCLSSAEEIELLNSDKHIVAPDWREHFPYHCSPFYTTAVMLVKKAKENSIRNWDDLFSKDVLVALPSPAISGLGRHAYLTLLANRLSTSPREAQKEVTKLMLKAHLYGLGAYQSFYCFLNDCKADVFITWENEAIRIVEREPQTYEIIYPSMGIIAEPTVAILHKYTQKRETTEQARAYLNYLFSKEGQIIAETNGLRPRIPNRIRNFPEIELKSITEIFGNLKETYQQHFAPNGTFQQILKLREAHIGGVE